MLRAVFWASAGAIAWTHAGYPAAAAVLARLRPRPVRKGDVTPSVSLVVAAHNEERVIAERIENLLALDYPPELLEIVIASDASTDRTDSIVEEFAARGDDAPRVRLLRCPRGGKVAAQHLAVRETTGEVVAFSDANSTWDPEALRLLVRNFADRDVGYVCGRVRLERPGGGNREGAYWRYELWLREKESLIGSITGGNGGIYAVRREDYVEDDPRYGHDLGFPYLMVQRGRRAVYEPAAVAVERPATELRDEFERKVRMLTQCWGHVLTGRMLRPTDPLYAAELVSHRLLRYATGLLHLAALGSAAAIADRAPVYRVALAAQLSGLSMVAAGKLRAPVPGASLAYYYFLVTEATLVGLVSYLRTGTPVVWDKAKGTR
jgi:glycosyltransferase involved in cell wall biosynthesis